MLPKRFRLAPLRRRDWSDSIAVYNELTGQTHLFTTQFGPVLDALANRALSTTSSFNLAHLAEGLSVDEQQLAQWIQLLLRHQLVVEADA